MLFLVLFEIDIMNVRDAIMGFSMELRIDHISKIYNSEFTALDDFTMTFSKGIGGLLGPKGAGKST